MFSASTSLASASSAGLAELGRVLDLHERDDVGPGLGDGGDDLVLLPLEVLRVRRAADVAAALDRDGVAVPVRCRSAAGDLVAGGGEVVQHVEGGELEVAAHGGRSPRPGGAEAGRLHGVRVGGRQLGQGLELPGAVRVAEHHVGLERHRRADPDGIRRGQVRQHLGLGGGVLEEVRGGAVVELDAAGGVRRDRGGVLRANRRTRRRWAAPARWCRRPGRSRRTGSARSCPPR